MNRTGRHFSAGWLTVLLLTPAAAVLAEAKVTPTPVNWSQTLLGEVGILDGVEPDEAGLTAATATRDGQLLATGHAGGLVRLWNPATGVELFVLRGQGRTIRVVGFKTNQTLLSVTAREIIHWDCRSGKSQKTSELPSGSCEQAVLTPDAETLVAATSAGRVLLFKTATGAELGRLERPVRPLLALACSPDGKVVACGEEGGGVSLWNLETRRLEVELSAEEPYLPRAVAFSPDGQLIAAALGRDGITIWDRGTRVRRTRLRTAPRTACALAFSPDGRGLLIGIITGQLLRYDLTTGQLGEPVRSHAGQIQQLLFLPAHRLLTSGTDTVVRLWRVYPPGEAAAPEPEPKLITREVTVLLDDLSSIAPGPSERAARTLLFLPQQAVTLLRQQIKPVVSADPKRFAQLLTDLSSQRYTRREKAFAEIQKMGEAAQGLIQQALASPIDLETHNRLRLLAKRLEKSDSSAEMRLAIRGVEVLGRLNSPEARQLLEELAAGVPGAHLTRAAQKALGRGG